MRTAWTQPWCTIIQYDTTDSCFGTRTHCDANKVDSRGSSYGHLSAFSQKVISVEKRHLRFTDHVYRPKRKRHRSMILENIPAWMHRKSQGHNRSFMHTIDQSHFSMSNETLITTAKVTILGWQCTEAVGPAPMQKPVMTLLRLHPSWKFSCFVFHTPAYGSSR